MSARCWRRTVALLCILALPAAAFAQAAVEGRVELPKGLRAPVMNKRYGIIAHAGVMAPFPPVAVVYLEGPFPRPVAPPTEQMVQKDLMFVPWLLPVQAGTRVEFPNLDDTYHNIFSYSPAKRFDLGRYRSDERPIPSELFDVPGLVTLRCDIHEHMRALILVLDTPHFVVSDTEGRYRLEGLPEGRFVLKAWLDSKRTLERPVQLKSGSTLRADFP
ncbi:MAG TPA: carboxypeptidase regulatory-like domain-containing protein [Opitutaceae bacterium]|nr:carboxypeptidase regulatory-like domain-containing protein [Opitutaceae bacterium]